MTQQDEIHDSPEKWVASHIRNYVETDGQKGHTFNGKPTLLLTTRGRKSGLLRRTALIYGVDGADYIVVASNGGSAKHPLWYLNIVETPEVEVQVGSEKFAALAHVATPEEKSRLWSLMTGIFPTYDSYQRKTKRAIPVIILQRRE